MMHYINWLILNPPILIYQGIDNTPPGDGFFKLLDGTFFMLLDGTRFELL